MISEFTLVNEETEKQFTFGQSSDYDFIFTSIDWGSASAQHNTYNYPNQVGVSVSSTKINPRDIVIEGYVFYVLSSKEFWEISRDEKELYCYDIIKSKKNNLSEVINPNDYVKLIVGNYYIEGKPNSSIVYGKEDSDNNIYFCKFSFSLFCNNPMFKKNTITKTNIQSSTPIFHFPLIIPKYEGITLSTRENYLMLAVENEGGVPIGGKIKLTAKGNVLNPTLENVLTGEVIKINKEMVEGEEIIINTVDGKERGITGYLNGVTRSYLQYWDFSNTWFKFLIGTTLIGYTTENASESYLDVVVEINPQKYSLEEL